MIEWISNYTYINLCHLLQYDHILGIFENMCRGVYMYQISLSTNKNLIFVELFHLFFMKIYNN
jgi:hypothetical protein